MPYSAQGIGLAWSCPWRSRLTSLRGEHSACVTTTCSCLGIHSILVCFNAELSGSGNSLPCSWLGSRSNQLDLVTYQLDAKHSGSLCPKLLLKHEVPWLHHSKAAMAECPSRQCRCLLPRMTPPWFYVLPGASPCFSTSLPGAASFLLSSRSFCCCGSGSSFSGGGFAEKDHFCL